MPLASDSLLQLRLAVFVRSARFGLPPPLGASASAEARAAAAHATAQRFSLYSWGHDAGGVPGVATKGALGCSLTLPASCGRDGAWSPGGQRLAFLCCHLAAHAGPGRAAVRNKQLREALCSLAGRGAAAAAATEEAEALAGASDAGGARLLEALHDHVFVFGDLNYRLDGGALQPAPVGAGCSHEAAAESVEEGRRGVTGWSAAVRAARCGDWHALARADELGAERAAGRCPLGAAYQEGPLWSFAPTFKLQPGGRAADGAYARKRVPAYTDRVLYWSSAVAEQGLAQAAYGSCEDVTSSDHRPVRALFSLRTREQ
jgi:hypothetical protein